MESEVTGSEIMQDRDSLLRTGPVLIPGDEWLRGCEKKELKELPGTQEKSPTLTVPAPRITTDVAAERMVANKELKSSVME